MQVPDSGLEGFAGLRRSASFDLPATPHAQWHHLGDFIGAVIATGNNPGALTAHAETGHINQVLFDTHFAFAVRNEPPEDPSIPLGNRFHRRDENITDEIGNVSTIACISGALSLSLSETMFRLP